MKTSRNTFILNGRRKMVFKLSFLSRLDTRHKCNLRDTQNVYANSWNVQKRQDSNRSQNNGSEREN